MSEELNVVDAMRNALIISTFQIAPEQNTYAIIGLYGMWT